MLLTSLPVVMAHAFPPLNCVMVQQTVQAERMRTEPTATPPPSPRPYPLHVMTVMFTGFTGFFAAPPLIPHPQNMILSLQLVGPTSSAVPPVGSVCPRPGIAMEKQTVLMAVMSSSVLPSADQARCPASVGTSVSITSSSVTGPHTAGMPQMRVSTTVVSPRHKT